MIADITRIRAARIKRLIAIGPCPSWWRPLAVYRWRKAMQAWKALALAEEMAHLAQVFAWVEQEETKVGEEAVN